MLGWSGERVIDVMRVFLVINHLLLILFCLPRGLTEDSDDIEYDIEYDIVEILEYAGYFSCSDDSFSFQHVRFFLDLQNRIF